MKKTIKIKDYINDSLLTRFWSKVEKTDNCWLWIGRKNHDGYGALAVRINKTSRSVFAHRVSWVLHNNQDFPDDKPVARHMCNNPGCVNPDHIVAGTQKENINDGIRAGNGGMLGKKHSEETKAHFRAIR